LAVPVDTSAAGTALLVVLTQVNEQLSPQFATWQYIQVGVNGFGAHTHILVVWVSLDEASADLLWRPVMM